MSPLNVAARTWSRWAAALAALVLVVTTVAAGARYVICLRTGTTHSHACCAKRHAKALTKGEQKAPRGAEIASSRSCCEAQAVPAPGVMAVEQALPALQATAATLPQEAWSVRPTFAPASLQPAMDWPIRAGPTAHAERLARLQVFLI